MTFAVEVLLNPEVRDPWGATVEISHSRVRYELEIQHWTDETLRVLALLTLLHDPKHRGLVCFEEPENGVHPGRLKELVVRLRALTTELTASDCGKQTLQVLVNSHSPVVLSGLADEEMLFADMVTVVQPGAGKSRRTRMRPVRRDKQASLDRNGETVGTYDVERYLSTVQGKEPSLP
jgi:predicted ATPase